MTSPLRLLTRSDFDGVVCAALLKQLGLISEIEFTHPREIQRGKFRVTPSDILTKLPFVDDCHLCFDHRSDRRTRKPLPVYMEKSITDLPQIYINGGKRGFLVGVTPQTVLDLLKPTLVEIGITK